MLSALRGHGETFKCEHGMSCFSAKFVNFVGIGLSTNFEHYGF